MPPKSTTDIPPLRLPSSRMTSEINKTGSWRFLTPFYLDKTSPCSVACPAGEDIGRIELLTAQGAFKEAWETILRENPFPGICGRICFHPCESRCNRQGFDEAVAIPVLERFLADTADRYELVSGLERQPARKEKIAVAGAGPSGLAAAYFLNRLGYECHVYEAASEPGGILRWGLPRYRLPLDVLQREIKRIEKAGVRIHCNRSLAPDFIEKPPKEYQGIFIGCGLSKRIMLEIPGETPDIVQDGLSFLKKIARGKVPDLSGTALIIGGGNTAMDVARSAVRLGAKARIVYRRRIEDMPAFADEIRTGVEEGVDILACHMPVKIERKGGRFQVTLQEMQVVDIGPGGRARMAPSQAPAVVVEADHVYKAIGAQGDPAWQAPLVSKMTQRLVNAVVIREEGKPILVFGGDLTTGVQSVVHAVASGKEAALAMDLLFQDATVKDIHYRLAAAQVGPGPALSMETYLKGPRAQRDPHVVTFGDINKDHFEFATRLVPPSLLKEERGRSFAEIDLKISAGLAIREAERCFNCGLCNQCDNCLLFCPDLAVARDGSPAGRHINYDYCKGCGICVVECPRNAMIFREDEDA